MDKTPIERAVDLVGGQKALADALKIKPAMVWQWVNGHRPVAAHHCLPIEQATSGAITRHDLRPDVFGAPSAEKAA